ncbi:MAG: pyridoxal-phosphate dependent enzyme [Planctomycetes bacterium]|nr:pyridoxal-phosphate dependent enzyme [Planctomycetota bacterium]
MSEPPPTSAPLHVRSRLITSEPLSRRHGGSVHLVMETDQPVRSFKIRGIGRLAQQRAAAGATELVSSSGGNAGYAAAYAGRRLGLAVTVVVPRSTTALARRRLIDEGATVIESGASWDDAHLHALEIARTRGAAYVHPFDDPEIWTGHSTMIDEVAEAGVRPDGVVVAVGGGGLLCGVLEGMHRHGWTTTPVLAVETEGAASFARSVEAGRCVTLDAITTLATTLGARRVASAALDWSRRHPVRPWVVTDAMAVRACRAFHDDHGEWVEPSCGAALSVLYESDDATSRWSDVLVIVCGGAGVDAEAVAGWEERLRTDGLGTESLAAETGDAKPRDDR